MANEKRGNMHYVDTTGVLSEKKNVKVSYIIITSTSATCELILKDVGASGPSLHLDISPTHTSQVFDFSRAPVVFPNGIEVTSMNNGHATLVLQEGYKS